MYELIQLASNTYYVDCPTKVGIYAQGDQVYLVDSGGGRDMGKKILKLLEEMGWKLKTIINTHSHADHIGGNRYLQDETGCNCYAEGIERCFCAYPELEAAFLYGGYPFKQLRNKFLSAPKSAVEPFRRLILPSGMETIPLRGHCFDMMGLKTPDDVWFLGDCAYDAAILEKYHAPFVYDVAGFLNTLDLVEQLQGQYFVFSHAGACQDVRELVRVNRQALRKVLEVVSDLSREPITFEELLKRFTDHFAIALDFNQYALMGSTLRSFLSYLLDQGRLSAHFEDNRLLWSSSSGF